MKRQANLKQNRTSLYVVVAAVVLLGAAIVYIQISNGGRTPKLTDSQRIDLAAKRKTFFDSCTAAAKYSSHVSDAAVQRYCGCSLQAVITEYYTNLSKPIPAVDDVTNLTDADAVLNFGDHLSGAQVSGIVETCASVIRG